MTYIFNDPVHGTIELEPVLVQIIDTPEFQRLRNIKQTGVAYYVYPGATHNRFEHCIGVCHLAGLMLDKLSTQRSITRVDKLCVQIAGLVHDVGHGPFSHQFDDSFIKNVSTAKWSHELQSCRIFDHIVETHEKVSSALKLAGLTAVDLLFIKELINAKDYKSDSEWLFKGRPKELSFLYEIVANERTGIDVDKFDYLLRDCYHLGVNCTLDWRRLVHMMRIVEIDGQQRIAIRDKEKDNVFNMFYLRMHLHRIAYQHPTCCAIDLMIRDILITCNDVLFDDMLISDSINHLERYLTLTDFILEIIANKEHTNVHPEHLEKAKKLIYRIKTRQLYVLVAQTPPTTLRFKDKEQILNDIVQGDNLLGETIHFSDVRLNFGKWGPTGDPLQAVLFYDKNGEVIPAKSYDQSSLFVPSSWSQQHLRMFCTSEDPSVVELARRKCNEWISRTSFS